MKAIKRVELTESTRQTLKRLTKKVVALPEAARSGKAIALWDRKLSPANRPAFDEIRRKLESMAPGRGRCMYCEDSFGTDIEHFFPKAEYPDRAFDWENYLLACSHCNSNLKREKFPMLKNEPLLLNPTVDNPLAHLWLLLTDGCFIALGDKGRHSIDVFALNERHQRNLPKGRLDTIERLRLLLRDYDLRVAAGDLDRAKLAKQLILDEPFSSVLEYILCIADSPSNFLIPTDFRELIRRHQVGSWLLSA